MNQYYYCYVEASTTAPERRALLTCTLCSSSDHCDANTYDRVFRLCPSPLLHQCRVSMNAQTHQYVLSTDLEKRLAPQLIQLVFSPDGHRICLVNWNTAQLSSLSSVLLPSDSSEAIHAVLLDFSRTLIPRIDALWEARKQAKYIEAVANRLEADPIIDYPPRSTPQV